MNKREESTEYIVTLMNEEKQGMHAAAAVVFVLFSIYFISVCSKKSSHIDRLNIEFFLCGDNFLMTKATLYRKTLSNG